jgi:hypothetical protein
MLKTILLAGSVMIAGPVLAQTATGTAQTPLAATQTAPVPSVPTPPAGAATTGQTAPVPTAPAAPQPAQTAAATDPSHVEQIIGREFGAYDKNKDGKLSQAEFDTWMVALKTASDPATRADAPATRAWLGAAFAQADLDKSRDVTQAELTGFLTQGQS